MAKCSQISDLSSLNDFSEYIDTLRQVTNFNDAELEACRTAVCLAVYGSGNPDISGIGVAIAYTIGTALGFCLCALLFFHNCLQGHTGARKGRDTQDDRVLGVLVAGTQSFFESAAYFAIAIQIAAIVIIYKKDFGLSTSDFGAIDAQIAQAVSLISLLPLLSPVILLDRMSGAELQTDTRDPRSNPRLFLLNLAVSLSFYPFISRSIHGFGASPISNSGEVGLSEWHSIEELCFRDGLDSLRSNALYSSLDGLEMATSLVIYLTTLWLQSGLLTIYFYGDGEAFRAGDPSAPHIRRSSGFRGVIALREKSKAWIGRNRACGWVLLLVPLALACPLLWVVFRLRDLQAEVVAHIGGGELEYSGNDWGFGQVVSIILFLPVVVAMFYRGRFYERRAVYAHPT